MDVAEALKSFGPFGVILAILWGLYIKERGKADADRAQLLSFMQKVYEQMLEREVENIRAKLALAGTLEAIGAAFDKVTREQQRTGLDVQREVDEISERIEYYKRPDGTPVTDPKGPADSPTAKPGSSSGTR